MSLWVCLKIVDWMKISVIVKCFCRQKLHAVRKGIFPDCPPPPPTAWVNFFYLPIIKHVPVFRWPSATHPQALQDHRCPDPQISGRSTLVTNHFQATCTGHFDETSSPNHSRMTLKTGTKVPHVCVTESQISIWFAQGPAGCMLQGILRWAHQATAK